MVAYGNSPICEGRFLGVITTKEFRKESPGEGVSSSFDFIPWMVIFILKGFLGNLETRQNYEIKEG